MNFFRRLRSLFRRGKLDADMREEMRQHIEEQTQRNVASGMDADEARYAAERMFGNVSSLEERSRDARGWVWFDQMRQDLSYAGRQLRRNPGFAAVAIVSLALGIAANTTIFSFVNSLLLRPPPVANPQSLWQIWRWQPKGHKNYSVWSRPEIAYLRENCRSLVEIGAVDSEPVSLSWNRDGVGQSVQALFVSGNFFDLCGVHPSRGRYFLPDEDKTPGLHPVLVVSYKFWRDRLGADPEAVGREMTVNGVALTVVGVASREFTGITAGISPDVWVPFMMVPEIVHDPDWLTRTNGHSVIGLGRSGAGFEEGRAAAELTTLTRAFNRMIRGRNDEFGAVLTPIEMVPEPLRGLVSGFTGILMGAVFLVLLIACANAANLQLARAVVRRQEIAVRSAMGAGRRRLVRQLLTESTLLAAVAGVLGLVTSIWLANAIVRLIPSSLPVRFETGIDWRVLAFTTAVSLFTGVAFGLMPAFRCTRPDLISTLKDEAHSTSVRRSRFAGFLIAAQMALCLILLVAATLCLRSLFNARAIDPGFEPKGRVAATINLGDYGYGTDKAAQFYSLLTTRVSELPGVDSAALTAFLPLGMEHANGMFAVERRSEDGPDESFAFQRFSVGAGYFATMGTRVLAGRGFTDGDGPGAPRVAVINEVAAQRYWPGEDPIGRHLFLGDRKPENALEIVGVVQTGRYRTLGEDPKPVFFECFDQNIGFRATLVAHVEDNPFTALSAISRVVRDLDPRLAPTDTTTLEDHLSIALFPVRATGLMLGVLGAVALVLAVSGLFGVIAYSISQRTREMGIRIALGARPGDMLRLVLRQGMWLSGIGVAAGIAGAFGVARLLRHLLYGISPNDPLTFVLVSATLVLVAFLACWLPARRAAKVDPIIALRAE